MFIKNYDQLATSENRKLVLDVIESAFASIQPHAVLDTHFVINGDKLTIVDKEFTLSDFERIHLVGLGKGSAEVCRIIEEKLGDKLTQGFDIDVVNEATFKKIQY